MTITEHIKTVEEALKEWTKGFGGNCFIVGDFVHLVESILSQKAGAPCAYIAFNEELPRNPDRPKTGKVDRGYLVVISNGKSLQINKGDLLVKGSAGGDPLYTYAEKAREICLGIDFGNPDPSENAKYRGMRPFQVEGLLLAAYQIEFTVDAQNPQRC